MKAFITQYALTEGIKEVKDCVLIETGCIYVSDFVVSEEDAFVVGYYYKPHWSKTWEDALLQAEQMRANKIKSLEKQIEKLKQLEFKKP